MISASPSVPILRFPGWPYTVISGFQECKSHRGSTWHLYILSMEVTKCPFHQTLLAQAVTKTHSIPKGSGHTVHPDEARCRIWVGRDCCIYLCKIQFATLTYLLKPLSGLICFSHWSIKRSDHAILLFNNKGDYSLLFVPYNQICFAELQVKKNMIIHWEILKHLLL